MAGWLSGVWDALTAIGLGYLLGGRSLQTIAVAFHTVMAVAGVEVEEQKAQRATRAPGGRRLPRLGHRDAPRASDDAEGRPVSGQE